MKFKYRLLVILAPLVFVVDQVTKILVLDRIALGTRIPVIPGFFDIVHFRNTGAAFGMLAETQDSFRVPFFYLVAIVATILLAFFYRSLKEDERLLPVALSLVFGGMGGNLLDRVRLGSVVDFLSVHIGSRSMEFDFVGRHFEFSLEWPAFNVADSAITIAMVLLLISAFKRRAI